jgi:hypothetical protein
MEPHGSGPGVLPFSGQMVIQVPLDFRSEKKLHISLVDKRKKGKTFHIKRENFAN